MEKFIERHRSKISGILSCFDRVLFDGRLHAGWPEAMEKLMNRKGIRIKNFKQFVNYQSQGIKQVLRIGCSYFKVVSKVCKDDYAQRIASGTWKSPKVWCVF